MVCARYPICGNTVTGYSFSLLHPGQCPVRRLSWPALLVSFFPDFRTTSLIGATEGVIFSCDGTDREVYCLVHARFLKRAGCRLWGYCWMTNHVHLPDEI